MSNYDPGELLVLWDPIMEDAELTYDELYKMAEWLNNHHEACFHWPGNLLLEPLQKAWADGKITRTEARQVARLIFQNPEGVGKTRSRAGFCSGSPRLHPKPLARSKRP